MKGKNILFIVGGIFVVAALAVMLVFVLSGNQEDLPDANYDFTGVWKIVADVEAGNVKLPEQEYIVFTEDSASFYRNGVEQPSDVSAYTAKISNSSPHTDYKITFSDIAMEYEVAASTENYIRLCQSSTVYLELVRYANADMSDVVLEQEMVVGSWDVAYRNTGDKVFEETICLEDGTLTDYRNGAAEPVATVPYYWNEQGHLCVDALNVEMVCYQLSEDILFFVEVATGYVWELHAVK